MARATTYEELDEIRAPGPLPEVGVETGDRGVVLEVFERPNLALLVEYADEEGRTKALVVYSSDLRQTFAVHPERST